MYVSFRRLSCSALSGNVIILSPVDAGIPGRIRSLGAPRRIRNNANCQRQKVSFKGIAEHKYLDCSRLPSLSFSLLHPSSLPLPLSLSLRVLVEIVEIVVVSKRRAGFASLRFLSSRDTRTAACVQDSRRSDTRGALLGIRYSALVSVPHRRHGVSAACTYREILDGKFIAARYVTYVRPSVDVLHLYRRAKMKCARSSMLPFCIAPCRY